MARFVALGEEARRFGLRNLGGDKRTIIALAEHDDVALPPDILRPDGTFDLYDDVQTRFEIAYRRREGRLTIRTGGWVGHIPINDRYALSVRPRVPVDNLERVLARSGDIRIDTLGDYTRMYGWTSEKPQSLRDVVADQFLEALERVWHQGLLKSYQREERIGAMPFGRINPCATELLTRRTRRPRAVFTAFSRTQNCGPNRVLRTATELLLQSYEALGGVEEQSRRVQRLRDAHRRFEGVATRAAAHELGEEATETAIDNLPVHHVAYVDALRVASLIVRGRGIRLTSSKGAAVLPVVLVDMANVFERYARQVLKREAAKRGALYVKDGNMGGPDGARVGLFSSCDIEGEDPRATPDIVIGDSVGVLAVVDVKYKPARVVPERAEINQVVTYGARYECSKVMVLYPSTVADGQPVASVGKIGGIRVYRGSIDLSAEDIESEEARSAVAVLDALERDD